MGLGIRTIKLSRGSPSYTLWFNGEMFVCKIHKVHDALKLR